MDIIPDCKLKLTSATTTATNHFEADGSYTHQRFGATLWHPKTTY